MTRTVVLIGAPGAGKTTVGRLLAQRLGIDHVDVDQAIEQQAGKPIGEIFADHGEEHFRALELAETLAALEGTGVVSLGGGAVMNPSIRDALTGRDVVWLKVSVPQATRRIGMGVGRPLLLGNVRGTLVKLLNERIPVYASVATLAVDTDRVDPEVIVDRIEAGLEEEAP